METFSSVWQQEKLVQHLHGGADKMSVSVKVRKIKPPKEKRGKTSF